MSESSLSRFISGKTDKLGDENIIRIARVFNVSTDFLLGEVDTPDRLNYDIAELGLSVQAARNLYTHKVNPQVVNALLENPEFSNTTNLISGYLDDELAKRRLFSISRFCASASPRLANAQSCSLVIRSLFMVL